MLTVSGVLCSSSLQHHRNVISVPSLSVAQSVAGWSCNHVKLCLSLSLSDVGVSDRLFREDEVWFDEFVSRVSWWHCLSESFWLWSHCLLVLLTRQESHTVAQMSLLDVPIQLPAFCCQSNSLRCQLKSMVNYHIRILYDVPRAQQIRSCRSSDAVRRGVVVLNVFHGCVWDRVWNSRCGQ